MIFIHIPKTAGWTIARHLRDDEDLMEKGFGFTHNITIRDVPENYEDNILSVVRCPFDRTWSMYNFYGFTRKDFLDVYTFEEFVSNIHEWSTDKEHEDYMLEYNPCYYWIEPRTFEETDYGWVDGNLHLLRYENLQKSYDIFRKTIGLDPFRLTKRNVNPKKKKETPKYTEEMVSNINSHFSSDIENFGYNYESYLQRGFK
jgi:hypothetical protein